MEKSYHHGDLKTAAIKKTVEIIQKKGEVDFTLREIAKGLKVSHTAVYRHFQSKQDLLSHIAEEGFRAMVQKFAKTIENARTPRQKLHASGYAYIEFALNNPGHYRSMFHQELRCANEQRPELDEIGAEAFASLITILQEGMKAQVFRKMDALVAARSIWSGIHGFSILLLDGQFASVQSKAEIQRAIEAHLDFLAESLLK